MTTACDSGYHEPNSASPFDPAENVNQVAASEGATSSSSEAFPALRQPERAKITEGEAGMMRSLIQAIIPTWQIPRTNRELNQLTADYNRLAFSLRHSHSELRQANSELKQAHSELDRANDEVRRLNDSVHRCQKELKVSQSEISKLQDKERSMRDFLIENSHSRLVSDRDVCERFTQLRQRIQRLASNKVYIIEEFGSLTLNDSWFEPRYIEALWSVSPKPGRLVILRSLMFQFLYHSILNGLLFDINDAKANSCLAGLCSPTPSLSQTLSHFERIMNDRGGKKSRPCHVQQFIAFSS
jgi:exonuclease VII small subunit